MTDTHETPLVEALRSRAWEHRQHRELRAKAADELERLTAELAEAQGNKAEQARHCQGLMAQLIEAREKMDRLLAHCPDAECHTCGEIVCPHGEPLHFHHDGCPACCTPSEGPDFEPDEGSGEGSDERFAIASTGDK